MKKIAIEILDSNPDENVVFMTEDGQGFFDLVKANNHATANEFEEPTPFYRDGFEPEDTTEVYEQLALVKEENQDLTAVILDIEKAVDFTKEAPIITQDSSDVVAAVVQLREKHQGSIALIDGIIVALVATEVIIDEKAEPVVVEIMKLRASLQSAQDEKATLVESLKNATTEKTDLAESLNRVQAELDTLKATAIEVKKEKTEPLVVPIAPKKS